MEIYYLECYTNIPLFTSLSIIMSLSIIYNIISTYNDVQKYAFIIICASGWLSLLKCSLSCSSRPGHTKDHHKEWYKLPSAWHTVVRGKEFDSAVRLSKRPDSVWNCLWGHALERSPVINRKSRVLYQHLGFLGSATCPLMPKKHFNGIINHNHKGEVK